MQVLPHLAVFAFSIYDIRSLRSADLGTRDLFLIQLLSPSIES